MEKTQIGRYDLKDNIMNSILFRIDYQGIIDIEGFIKKFSENFRDHFKSYETAFQNRIDLFMTSFDEISESLSIPVKEIEQQAIHRFRHFTIGTDELVFDISKYYTILQINCTDYQSIDPYLDFFANYCRFVYDINEFIQVKRLGLRKVGTALYDSPEELIQDFEAEYFHFDFKKAGFEPLKRELRDLLNTPEGLQVDFRRGFESGLVQTKEGDLIPKLQAILDFDGIVNEKQLYEQNFRERPKDLLVLLNHKYLFDVFKMSVTENFLEKNRKK